VLSYEHAPIRAAAPVRADPMSTDKVRENRLRRALDRQDYRLMKSSATGEAISIRAMTSTCSSSVRSGSGIMGI
jgi:hypothetical protein